MNSVNNIHCIFLLAGALLLAGCATKAVDNAPPASAQAPAREQANAARPDDNSLTGSRLARRSTDRMLKSVGSQEARNAMESNPRPLKGE
jgi:uncharacterized lipoprotein YajG